jgi:hypothetical protein
MPNYYYEVIQVNVDETGYYILESNSNVDTYGYIYEDNFNPFNPSENLLLEHDESCDSHHFKLTAVLQASTTYMLAVTTYYPNVTGAFSIVTYGLNTIHLSRTSKYLYNFINTQHIVIK